MIPVLKQWHEDESRIPMMRSVDMDKLTGAKEYVCTVRTPTISIERFLSRVELRDEDGEPFQAWCDTTTGTLYDLEGKCMSGPLSMIGKPRLSGRNIPGKAARLREGEQRAMIW